MKLLNNAMAERYAKTFGIQIVKVHSAAVIGPGNTAFSRQMIQFPRLENLDSPTGPQPDHAISSVSPTSAASTARSLWPVR